MLIPSIFSKLRLGMLLLPSSFSCRLTLLPLAALHAQTQTPTPTLLAAKSTLQK